MANLLLGFPNHVESTFYDVVFSGGSWESTLPLSNLADDDLSKAAQSTDATTASTQFHVDLGSLQSIRLAFVSSGNYSRSAKLRIRATATAKWTGAAVNTGASSGASSISMKATTGDFTITAGDSFTINGYTYESATTILVTAGGVTVSLEASPSNPGDVFSTLQDNISANDVVTCNHGLFDGTEDIDSGEFDVFNVIYPWGTLYWGHPSWWDGKVTEEERLQLTFPAIFLLDVFKVVRYFLFEFDDTTNADGYLALSKLFLTPGWQPTTNASYGATTQYTTETTFEQTISGIKKYDVKEPRRVTSFGLENLFTQEGIAQGIDMQRYLGTNRQFVLLWNPDSLTDINERALRHRNSYTATMRQLGPISYTYFNHTTVPVEAEEVLGGKLT